jgi:hypothetical protein
MRYQKTPYGYIIDGTEFVTPDKREAFEQSRKSPEQLAREMDYGEHNAEQLRKLMELDNEIGQAIKKRRGHLDAVEKGRARAEAEHVKDKQRLKEVGKTIRGVRKR